MCLRLKNNKSGMVLLVAIGVIMVIMVASATIVLRAVSTNTVNQRSRDSLEAYYEAEAGISYAYHEENMNGFKWYTHQDKDTKASTAPSVNIDGASIDATTGCYQAAGRNFLVKAFPETIGGTTTGMTIILSQGIVNGIKRTIEYRVGSAGTSVYKYFFFYPGDISLDSGSGAVTYDGRNYGGMHANGDILFKTLYSNCDVNFNFLTELSCGSNVDGKGYLRCPVKWQYAPPKGDVDYSSGYASILSSYNLQNTQRHFYTANIRFNTGPIDSPAEILLPGYLDDDEYSGAAWDYDKYYGTTTTPTHCRIDNSDLRYVAAKQTSSYYSQPTVTNTMMSKDLTVTIPGVFPSEATATEFDMFKKMNSGYYPASKWNDLWLQWKQNHADDYAALHTSGQLIEAPEVDPYSDLTLNRDWERRFWKHNFGSGWHDQTSSTDYTPNGIPDAMNMEWWEDMEYGSDAAQELVPARMEDYYTGAYTNKYFLDTEHQAAAWANWIATNNLNQSGTDKTLVQDRNTGGQYLDPTAFLESATNTLVLIQKAKEGGIYIGLNEDGTAFVNPIPDCTQFTQFYNVLNTPRDENGKYAPSSVLKIDVAALKSAIDTAKAKPADERSEAEQKLAAFNGVIYADLAGYDWSGLGTNYSEDADAVMLYNGARLPDGGLSLGTPNNIMIKGDYNLDPVGVPSKNRDADDTTVTSRYSGTSLSWQPAEVVTKRMIYTLSNTYPEPQYMPMYDGTYYEYYGDILSGRSHYHFLDDYDFPTPNSGSDTPSPYDDVDWMPTVAQTRSYCWSDVDRFFNNYPSVPVPVTWSRAWADQYWIPEQTYTVDWRRTMTGQELRDRVSNYNYNVYIDTFNFEAVHGADGTQNPEKPSFINTVEDKQIYNTAIITPYNTQGYTLENWRNEDTWERTPRIINGNFIQLPNSAEYKLPVPATLSYTSSKVYSPDFIDDPWCTGPTNTYVYESRFGLNANPEDLPRSNLTFGAANSYSSWRERKNADF